jgi:hypothetical protein
VVEEALWGMSEEVAGSGRDDLARALADLNVPATDYALAYRTLCRARMEDNIDEETFSWGLSWGALPRLRHQYPRVVAKKWAR